MEFLVVNQTKYLHGAHATTMLINEYVGARLGNYGTAVREIEVTLLYPPKRLSGPPADPFDAEFRRNLRHSPRATFYRAKRRIDIRAVCRGVSPRSITKNGHLTFEEATLLVAAASEALELIRTKGIPDRGFDCDAFLLDVQDALLRCPKAIRRWR